MKPMYLKNVQLNTEYEFVKERRNNDIMSAAEVMYGVHLKRRSNVDISQVYV